MRFSTIVLPFLLLGLVFLPGLGHATIIQIGSGSNTASASGVTPFSTLYEDGRHQYIILASELAAAGAVAGPITSLGFNVLSAGSPAMSGFNIKLGATSATTLSGVVTSGLTTYYSSVSYTAVSGWNTFPFSGSFNWNGTSNILVEVCYDNTTWSGNSVVYVFTVSAGRTYGLYDDGVTGCSMTSGSGGAQTAMPQMQLNATTGSLCAVGQVINVSSLPYSVTGATTCGAGNDVASAVTCGSSSYLGGEDNVYVFTPTTTGVHNIALSSSSSWVGLMLYSGCPLTGACVGNAQSSSGSQVLNPSLTAGTTYYLIVDTWPSPTCIPSYNLNINPPSTGSDPCASITTLACGTPATVTLAGTGVWNNSTCLFSTPGQEKVYSFTPTSTGVHTLQITSASGTGYIDYQYKAASGGCISSGWTCIDDINFTTTVTIGTLTAGVQYYILLDAESTTSSTQTFQINCPTQDPCSAITTLACATPATATLSGSGVWNNSTCLFSTPGQEKVYSFTPTTTGVHTLQVTSASATGYIDYQYKAASGGCISTGWTCIDDINFTTTITIGTLTAGVQYYILLDAENTTTSTTQTFQINCPAATPSCLASPTSPTNGASFCLPGPGTLSWPAAPGATGYEVYFGTSPTPPLYTTTPSTSVSVGSLTAGIYYWQIRPSNSSGTAGGCPIWSFTVDLTPPTISNCPNNQNVLRNASCVATLPDYTGIPTTGDNCSGVITVTQMPLPGAELSGTVTVTLTATDAAGNPATCSFTATPVDQTLPTLNNCPGNQTASVDANCQGVLADYTVGVTASDNCPGVGAVTQSPAPGSTFTGTTIVTLSATDASNNTGTCSFTVEVSDNTPPTITCPGTQTLVLGANCTATLPDYTGLATTGDNCGVQGVTQSPPAGTSVSGAGNMTVTLTVTDGNNLTNTCTFTVTKVDNTPPTITCPATQTLALGANCTATLPNYTGLATTGDNCGVQSVTQSPPAGTPVTGAGNMTVTLTATDGNNLTNTCTFTVTKVDNTPPTITCPATQTLALGANCTATLPNYTGLATTGDNCGVQGVTQSPPAGTPVTGAGNMTVTLTVTDGNNLTNTCTFTVTKVDNTPPTVVCRQASVQLQGTQYILAAADVLNLAAGSDNCGQIQVTNISPAQVGCDQIGQTLQVQVTATDGNGNNATCMASILVNKDSALPPGWTAANVGTTAAGSSSYDYCENQGEFTLSANGYTTNTTDVQHSVYQNLCGNSEIIAHVTSISTMGGWAGLQMRESTSQGSKKFTLKTQLNTILRREARSVTFGPTNTLQMAVPPSHTWLRITRAGNVFTAYSSADGINWAFRGTATIAMNSCLQVGLFVESINNTTTTQATFDNVFTSGGNQPLVEAPNTHGVTEMETSQVEKIHEFSLHEFSLYPNPTTGEIHIDLTQYAGRPVRLEVYSLQGRLLHFAEIAEVQNLERLDLSTYENGMYLIKVKSEGLPDVTKRIVLAR